LTELRADLGPCEDPRDAGRLPREGDIEPPDVRVPVRAPHEGGVQGSGQWKVGDIALTGGEESRIFLALERLADEAAAHGNPPLPRRTRGPRSGRPRSARWPE